MVLKQVIETVDLLDGNITGEEVAQVLKEKGLKDVSITQVSSDKGRTDFLKIVIPGFAGKSRGGNVPTLGIIGRLGGIGARPGRIGLVSDGDGALVAVAIGQKIAHMIKKGDCLPGDVIIATHICPNAPIMPHDPVPFMDSPVDMFTLNKYEVSQEMEAIISVDATKGNRILNRRGIAITPTIKEGYILPVSNSLLDILSNVTGRLPEVLALSTYDITPYGNSLPHINSIVQPAVAAKCPVVGLAITAQISVAGCATGASHEIDLAEAVRFCLEVAKEMARGLDLFYDNQHYKAAQKLYGSFNQLQQPIC